MEDEQRAGIADDDVEAHQKTHGAVDDADTDEPDVEAHQKTHGAADDGPDFEGHMKSGKN